MSENQALELRNAAYRAILTLIDANKHRQTTKRERTAKLTETAQKQHLQRKNLAGALIPYEEDRGMYALLSDSRKHGKKSIFGQRHPSMDEMWKHGSSGFEEEWLKEIGFISPRKPSCMTSSSLSSRSDEQTQKDLVVVREPKRTFSEAFANPPDTTAPTRHFAAPTSPRTKRRHSYHNTSIDPSIAGNRSQLGNLTAPTRDLVAPTSSKREGRHDSGNIGHNTSVVGHQYHLGSSTAPTTIHVAQSQETHDKPSLISQSELKQEWGDLLDLTMSAVVNFLASCGNDPSGSTTFVPNASDELQDLYDTVLGKRRYLIMDHLGAGLLEEYHILLSLVGAVVGKILDTGAEYDHGPLDESDERIDLLLRTLEARGIDCEDILRDTNFSWVSSSSYQMQCIRPEATRLSEHWSGDVLRPHLQLIYQKSPNHTQRLTKCLEIFEEGMHKIVSAALSLQARLRVTEDHACYRPDVDAVSDRKSMQDLSRDPLQRGFRVITTILPGLKKVVEEHETVVCKAVVVVHGDNRGDADDGDDTPLATVLERKASKIAGKEDHGTLGDKDDGGSHDDCVEASRKKVLHESVMQPEPSKSASHTPGRQVGAVISNATPGLSAKVNQDDARQNLPDYAPDSNLIDTKKALALIGQMKDLSKADKTTAILQSPDRHYLAHVEVEMCKRLGIMCDKFLFVKRKLFELFMQHRSQHMNRQGIANNSKMPAWSTTCAKSRLGIDNTKGVFIFGFYKEVGFFDEKYYEEDPRREPDVDEEDELGASHGGKFESGLSEGVTMGSAA